MQSPGIATKVIAASFALAAFAVAIVAGLAAANPAGTVLFNAVLSMIACQFIGLFIGIVAERAVAEHVEQYKSANPVAATGPESAHEKNSVAG